MRGRIFNNNNNKWVQINNRNKKIVLKIINGRERGLYNNNNKFTIN
jgi:hypothetical protein